MPGSSVNVPAVRGRVARFTLTDACGFPQIASSMYTTDGFITVNSTKNMDTGDEIKVRQANGIIGVHEPGQVSLLNFSNDINLVRIDPGLLTMLTGDPGILDASGNIVGWEEKASLPIKQNFAMEVWTDTSATACSAGSRLYGYMLYPLLGQGYVTLDNIADKEVTATIHALSYGSPGWGRGPYGNGPSGTPTPDGSSITGPVNTATVAPAKAGRLLVAVDPNAHRHFEVTVIPPPASQATPGPISITLPTTY